MKKFIVNKSTIIMLMIAGFMVTSIFSASATYTVCFDSGPCFTLEGDCSTVCCYCTCTNASIIAYNQNTDYILAVDGHAWLVVGGKKTPIGSDKLKAFMDSMNKKYPIGKRESVAAQKLIAAEYAKFFKLKDTSLVSKERWEKIAKETGLKVRTKA